MYEWFFWEERNPFLSGEFFSGLMLREGMNQLTLGLLTVVCICMSVCSIRLVEPFDTVPRFVMFFFGCVVGGVGIEWYHYVLSRHVQHT